MHAHDFERKREEIYEDLLDHKFWTESLQLGLFRVTNDSEHWRSLYIRDLLISAIVITMKSIKFLLDNDSTSLHKSYEQRFHLVSPVKLSSEKIYHNCVYITIFFIKKSECKIKILIDAEDELNYSITLYWYNNIALACDSSQLGNL